MGQRDLVPSLEQIIGIEARAKVLLLGTFHFAYHNLDIHNPEKQIDILSAERQAEVAEVVRLLSAFRPTKIAVEARLEREAALNAEYQAYRAGTFTLPAAEEYQLGFRLAAQFGHERLYAIDEWGRLYDSYEHLFEYARQRLGEKATHLSEGQLQMSLYEAVFNDYSKLVRYGDDFFARVGLQQYLLFLNSAEYTRVSHGAYLAWVDGEPGDYTLADYITGWWYNRNLRIFANLKRITESADDRMLVIYGAGHVPILRHALQSSPRHELVEVASYLAPTKR